MITANGMPFTAYVRAYAQGRPAGTPPRSVPAETVRASVLGKTQVGEDYTVAELIAATGNHVDAIDRALTILVARGQFERMFSYRGGRGRVQQRYRRLK